MIKQKGFIALSSVLLVSAVVLSIAVSASLLAIGESQSALAATQGEKTLNLVESCTDEALLKLRSSSTYSGGTITLPTGSCTVTVSSASNVYTVTVTNSNTDFSRTIRTVVTRANQITIQSWKEI